MESGVSQHRLFRPVQGIEHISLRSARSIVGRIAKQPEESDRAQPIMGQLLEIVQFGGFGRRLRAWVFTGNTVTRGVDGDEQ